jgi:acyl-CoA reductase-like NAD-dependent aldehyde dehydrogenase
VLTRAPVVMRRARTPEHDLRNSGWGRHRAVSAKLARLIESRAEELAEAMTAEQIAELFERRATEKAKELREEQKRLETEA